jgi:hypothetical protein
MLLPFASLLLVSVVAADCSADNCLRALRSNHVQGGVEAGQAFCGLFMSNSQPAPVIPSYAAEACKDNQKGTLSFRLASACGCIAAATTSTTTASSSRTLSATTTSFAATTTSAVTSPSTVAACALVSSSWAAQSATAPGGSSPHHVMIFTDLLSNTYRRCPTCS